MENRTVGDMIRRARLEQNMTQKQLAAQLSITDKAVSKWECGAGNPDITLILKLSAVLHLDIGILLKRYEKP